MDIYILLRLEVFSISCYKLHSDILFTFYVYENHTILDFNLICIFEFSFKRTLTPFYIFFLFIKTYKLKSDIDHPHQNHIQ